MYGYHSYRSTEVKTADRKQIIILLYESAIQHLNEAVEIIISEKPLESTTHVKKTLEIVNLLRNAIDFDKGGEIAENLANLYDYLRDNVNLGAIEKDPEKFKEAASLLGTLLEGWRSSLTSSSPDITVKQSSQEPLRASL